MRAPVFYNWKHVSRAQIREHKCERKKRETEVKANIKSSGSRPEGKLPDVIWSFLSRSSTGKWKSVLLSENRILYTTFCGISWLECKAVGAVTFLTYLLSWLFIALTFVPEFLRSPYFGLAVVPEFTQPVADKAEFLRRNEKENALTIGQFSHRGMSSVGCRHFH